MGQISIHAAREGGDRYADYVTQAQVISIHAAREGGDYAVIYGFTQNGISIHAAREGGDCVHSSTQCEHGAFQSTPPVKAATGLQHRERNCACISIHAAREGGD